jgi:hypothetical protein
MTWALEEAPDLPPHLLGTLLALANHAGRDGTGARPSQETLAWYTRKARRNVRKDIDSLLKLGLIREGDQRLVAHIRPDRRPVVYDLAMERKRAALRLDEGMQTSPRSVGTGGRTDPPGTPLRGDAHVPNGGMPASPKPSTEPTSSSSSALSAPVARIAEALSIEEEEARKVFQKIKTERRPIAPSKYVDHLIAIGDIENFHDAPQPTETTGGPRCPYVEDPDNPGWCATCHTTKGNARHRGAAA